MKLQHIHGYVVNVLRPQRGRNRHTPKHRGFALEIGERVWRAEHRRADANCPFVLVCDRSTWCGGKTTEAEAERIARSSGLYATRDEAMKAAIAEADRRADICEEARRKAGRLA